MIAPNTLLQNRYLVESLLAEGGMGAVYRATDQRFHSIVALKQHTGTTPDTASAFEREAKLLFSLRHESLPRVMDYFTDEYGQFLVMEFIPGDDLHGMLTKQGRPFPLDQVMAWAEQLLGVLDYLHRQSPPVIHRDIKPQNLKLIENQRVVLLDFGIAKGGAQQTRRTTGGSMRYYTPEYAPVEQVQGAGTDARSDIYALAATLYHLATGENPADALTRATTLSFQKPDPLRPPHEVSPNVPQPVSHVLMQAMALQQEMRPSSAAQFWQMLQAAQAGHMPPQRKHTTSFYEAPTVQVPQQGATLHSQPTVVNPQGPGQQHTTSFYEAPTVANQPPGGTVPPQQTPPPPEPPSRWKSCLWPIIGAMVTIALILFLLSVGSSQSGEDQEATETPTTTVEPSPSPTAEPTEEPTETPSPTEEPPTAVPEPTTPPPEPTTPPPPPSGGNPVTPDNVGAVGQTRQWTNHFDKVNHVAFASNGQFIASASDDDTIHLWKPSGEMLAPPLQGHRDDVTTVAIAPDGQTLASGADDERIIIWRTDGTIVRELDKQHQDDITELAYSPDGQLLASAGRDGIVRIWRTSDGARLDELPADNQQVLSVAFSPDGTLLAYGVADGTIRVWPVAQGRVFHKMEGHGGAVNSVAFSPDGTLLASGSEDDTINLWRMPDRTLVRTLRGHRSSVLGVAFSPDGQLLASGSKDKTVRLWRVSDGTALREMSGNEEDISDVAFSPDGHYLLASSEDGTVKVWEAP